MEELYEESHTMSNIINMVSELLSMDSECRSALEVQFQKA